MTFVFEKSPRPLAEVDPSGLSDEAPTVQTKWEKRHLVVHDASGWHGLLLLLQDVLTMTMSGVLHPPPNFPHTSDLLKARAPNVFSQTLSLKYISRIH